MTTATEAKAALFGAVRTAWLANSTSAPVTLYYQDVKAEMPETVSSTTGRVDPFARLSMIHAGGAQETQGNVGNRRFMSFGTFTMQIFTAPNDGNAFGYDLGEIARGILQGIRSENGVRLNFISPPTEVGLSGAWLQMNVTAEFEYDEVA